MSFSKTQIYFLGDFILVIRNLLICRLLIAANPKYAYQEIYSTTLVTH